jgi:NAD(P)-dependent dehydrogenase (short-subunit alcohol dehydrogenase family)
VTGGSSGIGSAIVAGFVRQGARVTFLDVQEPEGAGAGHDAAGATFVRCDLTDLNALERAIRDAAGERGPVEVLVNNAASDDRHTLQDVTAEYFDQRMAVNLRHFVFAARAVVPAMQERKQGVIVNLGSTAWHLAVPNLLLYETAKAGIEGLTRSLARDLGPQGIRVVCILPGAVETPRQHKWYTPEQVEELLRQQCLPVRIQPADVAALTLFLASDDARCCTAHNYYIDAGLR